MVLIHVGYLPLPPSIGELKSKPLQQSVQELNSLGLQPDFIVARSEKAIDKKRKEKIALASGLSKEEIIANPDVDSIYKVPLVLEEQSLADKILKKLDLKTKDKDLEKWKKLVKKVEEVGKDGRRIKVGIVGKYQTTGDYLLSDSYVCVVEAIKHAAWHLRVEPEIVWFDAQNLEKWGKKKLADRLGRIDGLIVPQGWGSRGVEGKIRAIRFARENKIPFLGLCFGMQMAVIEFARYVCDLKRANSTEVNPRTPHPVIHIMPGQKKYLEKHQYGGTIRLGQWPCKVKKETVLWEAYTRKSEIRNPKFETNSKFKIPNSKLVVQERHRHRFEVNNRYKRSLKSKGMIISVTSPDGKLVEAVELPKSRHPFFVGTQFHPEYQSAPLKPHPLFLSFVEAAIMKK